MERIMSSSPSTNLTNRLAMVHLELSGKFFSFFGKETYFLKKMFKIFLKNGTFLSIIF